MHRRNLQFTIAAVQRNDDSLKDATVEMQNIQIDREEIIVEEVIIDVPNDTDEINPEGPKPEKGPIDIVDSVSDEGSVGTSLGTSVGTSVGGMRTVAKP